MRPRSITIRIIVLFTLVGCLLISNSFADFSKTTSDGASATVERIYSKGNILFVELNFKNTNSSPTMFLTKFSSEVFQDGRNCTTNYDGNRNLIEKIKDGASVRVVESFNLMNSRSLVEYDLDQSFSFSSTPIQVYFNPITQKWGSKAEASTTATPKVTEEPTPCPESDNKQEKIENTSSSWICPSCGRELDSRFCPDCGVPSPTPEPTPSPTPEPTKVPMDISKPVDNVINKDYTFMFNDYIDKGEYTGEIVDGFPHGFGLFMAENGAWHYIGEWSFGLPNENGEFYFGNGEKTFREPTPSDTIIGDWYLHATFKSDKLVNGPDEVKFSKLTFDPDGSLVIEESSGTLNGYWKYDDDKLVGHAGTKNGEITFEDGKLKWQTGKWCWVYAR